MRHTVLVIDDQWSMQELARIVLQTAGFRVLLAGDGATGLSLARTEHPDAILLDLRMPGLDGLDVLRVLRQQAGTAEIPVLLITPDAGEEAQAAERRAGTAEILRKPFHPPELLRGVQNLLARPTLPVAMTG